MGKKGKGGGLMAGGKGEFKAMVALGIEVGRGDLDEDGGGSWPAASPTFGGSKMEEVAVDLYMEEVVAGGELDVDGCQGGMGIDPLVHMVLGGGEGVWPILQAAGGGAGEGKSPKGMEASGISLRSGRMCGVPVVGSGGKQVNSGMQVNSAMQRCSGVWAGEGCSSSAPVVAGGSAGGGGQVAGDSLLGVAPAAGVLGGGPAGYGLGMAGLSFGKEEGHWEEVAGGCEVKSGDLCGGKMWVVDGKMWASRRWVEGGGDGRNMMKVGVSGGGVEGYVGGKVVAGGCGAVAGGVAAGVAGVAGEAVAAGRQGEAGGGDVKLGEGGGVVGRCGLEMAAGVGVAAGVVVMAGAAVVAEGAVVAGKVGVAGEVRVAGRQREAGGGGGVLGVGGGEVLVEKCTQGVWGNASTPPCLGYQGNLGQPADAGQHSGAASGPATAAACDSGGQRPLAAVRQDGPGDCPGSGPAPKGPVPRAWSGKKCHPIAFADVRADYVSADGLAARIDVADAAVCAARLDRALVGRVLGRVLPFGVLCRELRRLWSKVGAIQISSLGSSCFVCFFPSQEVRDLVLMGGPWFAEGHLIGVDRWSPHFDPASLDGLSSPIWARFPGLPLHLWGDRNLGRIASMVGTPMWVDEVTATWERTEYARVCVRIDLSTSLPSGVWVEDAEKRFFQPVTFEGLDQLCFRCGRAGHSREECGVSAKAGRSSTVRPDGPGPSDSSVAPQPPGEFPAGSYAAATVAVPAAVSSVLDGPAMVSDDDGWQRVERRRVRSPPRFLGGARTAVVVASLDGLRGGPLPGPLGSVRCLVRSVGMCEVGCTWRAPLGLRVSLWLEAPLASRGGSRLWRPLLRSGLLLRSPMWRALLVGRRTTPWPLWSLMPRCSRVLWWRALGSAKRGAPPPCVRHLVAAGALPLSRDDGYTFSLVDPQGSP